MGLALALRMASTTSAGTHGDGARSSTHTPSRAGAAARTFARGLALSVAMAGLGYVGGRIHGRYEVSGAEAQLQQATDEHRRALESALTEHREALSAARAAADEARVQRARMGELTTLYEGYRMGQHALDALDARNFGIAQSHLRNTEVMLRPLAEHIEGLPQVVEEVASTNIVVASNLAPQRQAVTAIVSRLDRVLTKERNTLGMGEPPPTAALLRDEPPAAASAAGAAADLGALPDAPVEVPSPVVTSERTP